MSNKEIALKLTEKIIDNRGDEYYYTETGVINLYKRVLKEIKKLEKQEYYIPKQKIIDKINEINKKYEDSKDENGESFYFDPKYTIRVLKRLLQESEDK